MINGIDTVKTTKNKKQMWYCLVAAHCHTSFLTGWATTSGYVFTFLHAFLDEDIITSIIIKLFTISWQLQVPRDFFLQSLLADVVIPHIQTPFYEPNYYRWTVLKVSKENVVILQNSVVIWFNNTAADV